MQDHVANRHSVCSFDEGKPDEEAAIHPRAWHPVEELLNGTRITEKDNEGDNIMVDERKIYDEITYNNKIYLTNKIK